MTGIVEVEVDLRFLPGAEQRGLRPAVTTLGGIARDFIADGGPPPVPRPVRGRVEGVDLPLFYAGLNGLAGPSGVGKSLLMKFLARQLAEAGEPVLVLDCETSKAEYAATMAGDLAMTPDLLDLVHYGVTDQRTTSYQDRWSGKDGRFAEVLDGLGGFSPSLVLIDSQSKSMALSGMDENVAGHCTRWYEEVAVPISDRWPEAAVLMIQGRQKGWEVGMDVRQGRGSSSMLHEVHGQYMLWPKDRGSRFKDGLANLVCTKCRYGWREEGSPAAQWRYGPQGFSLRAPEPDGGPLEPGPVREAWLDLLADARDPKHPDLPLKEEEAVKRVMALLATKDRAGVEKVLAGLVGEGLVVKEQTIQPNVPGVRPWRVRLADGP